MRSLLLCVVLVLAAVSCDASAMGKVRIPPKWHELTGYTFEQYVADFHKSYADPKEHMRRKTIFENRMKEIQAHNADTTLTWKKGVNKMTDWTDQERLRLNGNILRTENSKSRPERIHVSSGRQLPKVVDYRNANPRILTDVKDQGFCGSCWSHSATQTIESYWALNKGPLYTLSQQQINSCAPDPLQCGGNGGCTGNIYEYAFDYVVGAGGIAQEWTYPYTSYNGTTHRCNNGTTGILAPVATVTGYTHVTTNDVEAVQDALANVGPLSIGLDASEWFDYEGGVFTGCDYAKNISLDHAVQLVGYGHDYTSGLDYWIVRNSWSPYWGENGYIRLHKSAQPQCGWNVNNRQGMGCENSPNTIWVCGMCGLAIDATYVNTP
jgi:cathepsin L